MAHFVKLNDDNIVVDKQVVKNEVITDSDGNEQESLGIEFFRTLFSEPTANWKQTSYNSTIRHKFADLQDEYLPDVDQFRQQAPVDFPSWVYNEEKKAYVPPIEAPQDGPSYDWNEATTSWVISPIQTKAAYLDQGTNNNAFDPDSDELYFPNN
tara:strand:+ start:100 stop:561 length:462 start_codon:yes stop_codon:yes gene_type:complete